ncbi:MAG: hypothetical protein JW876_03705 [Candidatus Krumholzibacteriota bacterium]|nr:hypothetical protein [Candidatus Krumholzibacteriota bacterium]
MSSDTGPTAEGSVSRRIGIDRFLESCADLVAREAGEGRLAGCFVCGSFATGEESLVEDAGDAILLSDVDLVAVVRDLDTHRSILSRKRSIGEACEALLPEVRFAGRVDVGVLLADEISALPHSPGIYDLRERGRVLLGPPELLEGIPDRDPARIGGREGLRLVENRVPPLFAAHVLGESTGVDRWRFLYALCRVYTDIATAALCLAGRYVPGYAERSTRFGEIAGGKVAWKELREPVERWTRFKIEPGRGIAREAIGDTGDEELWDRAAADLLRFWRRAAASVAGRDPVEGEKTDVGLMIEENSLRARRLTNARRWAALLRGLGTTDGLRAAGALRGRMLTVDPEAFIRLSALSILDARVAGGKNATVGGAPGGFPFGAGSWEEAARLVTRHWHRLVFDREEG